MSKRILITGTSRGLGKVAAQSFIEDGHEVIAFDRSRCDFLHLEQWDHQLPELDCVIHCAGGGLGLRDPLIPAASLYELFVSNLGGAAEINRIAIPGMKERGWGRVIHIASIASGEAVGGLGYNVCKAALAAYVRSLGREMAPHGIVITGISPGGFQCPGNAMERLRDTNPSAYQDFINRRLPRGYMGQGSELIPLLRFLASDEASMMGGCVVPIDAGEGHYY